MLLVFAATGGSSGATPPSLPELNIEDAVSGTPVPVGGLEGWDSDYIQTQAICYGPLQFSAEESAVSGESGQYWTRRLSNLVVRPVFTDAGATAVIRVIRIDGNDVKSYSEQITISATAITDGSNYQGESIIVPTYGSSKMAVHVESVSSGSVNLRFAGV